MIVGNVIKVKEEERLREVKESMDMRDVSETGKEKNEEEEMVNVGEFLNVVVKEEQGKLIFEENDEKEDDGLLLEQEVEEKNMTMGIDLP